MSAIGAGKTALITGANRGIGLETARQLGKLGFRVLVGARDHGSAEKASNTLIAEGIKAEPVVIDITNDDSVKAAAADVSKRTNGALDVLVNNAGVIGRGAVPGLGKVNLDDVRMCYEVNVLGTARVGNHFVDLVIAAPAGRIVNLTSIMGSLTLMPADISAFAYNASKTAENMYTVNLADALKETKVKVNSAHPGWVKTEMGGDSAPLSIEEGAETSVFLATLPEDGPTGGYFHKKERLPW